MRLRDSGRDAARGKGRGAGPGREAGRAARSPNPPRGGGSVPEDGTFEMTSGENPVATSRPAVGGFARRCLRATVTPPGFERRLTVPADFALAAGPYLPQPATPLDRCFLSGWDRFSWGSIAGMIHGLGF